MPTNCGPPEGQNHERRGMEKIVLEEIQPLPENATLLQQREGRNCSEAWLLLVSSSILLKINFVKTARETWEHGFQEKAWGEAESGQALKRVATVLRCCRSWETCRGSRTHCSEPPGSGVGPASPGGSI